MKRKVYITASTLFTPGTAERTLAELGAGPISTDARGRIIAHLTQHQIDLWAIKGPAHRLEVAPEVEPEPAPVAEPASPAPAEVPFVPSIIIETAPGEGKVVSIGDPHPVPELLKPDTSKLEPAKQPHLEPAS